MENLINKKYKNTDFNDKYLHRADISWSHSAFQIQFQDDETASITSVRLYIYIASLGRGNRLIKNHVYPFTNKCNRELSTYINNLFDKVYDDFDDINNDKINNKINFLLDKEENYAV